MNTFSDTLINGTLISVGKIKSYDDIVSGGKLYASNYTKEDADALQTLKSLLVDNDADTIVNKIPEILKIFENYKEGYDIVEMFNKKANSSDVYTQSEINTKLDTKADKSDTYTKLDTKLEASDLEPYAKTEDVNNSLNLKADKSNTYTKDEVDTKLNTKANSSDVYKKTDTYAKSEVDNKLGEKADITSVPSKVSELTNDEGYIKDIPNAFTYSNLKGKPTIPTKTSQLTNDSDFITSSGSCSYATSSGSATNDSDGNKINTTYAKNDSVVKLTGDQTIAGTKTFSSTIVGSISGNATTATNDSDGNKIITTYATKTEVNQIYSNIPKLPIRWSNSYGLYIPDSALATLNKSIEKLNNVYTNIYIVFFRYLPKKRRWTHPLSTKDSNIDVYNNIKFGSTYTANQKSFKYIRTLIKLDNTIQNVLSDSAVDDGYSLVSRNDFIRDVVKHRMADANGIEKTEDIDFSKSYSPETIKFSGSRKNKWNPNPLDINDMIDCSNSDAIVNLIEYQLGSTNVNEFIFGYRLVGTTATECIEGPITKFRLKLRRTNNCFDFNLAYTYNVINIE